MKTGNKLFIVALALIAAAVVCVVALASYSKNRANTAKYSANGWLQSLFNNGSDILDSAGRLTTSPITATGNAISSIIATSKSDGELRAAEYGYADKKPVNYGPYVIAGSVILLTGIILLSKN